MKNILKQLLSFVIISGIGFVLDFTTYFILINFINLQISYANMISAIPAITYVFFMSTKKVFNEKKSNIDISIKYVVYFIYQIILVSLVSLLAQLIYDNLIEILPKSIIINNLKIIIKLLITPITMTCNFFVMKILSEKL